MQYHLHGYSSGDPAIVSKADRVGESPDKVDVLIIGCGPSGLTLASQLAYFGDINTRIVEAKTGPLTVGQADGVACRSMEIFEAFGFADKVKKEAYWVNEVAFWRPNTQGDNVIARADRIQDVEDGLSEMPHTILNQARIHDFYLEYMRHSARRMVPDYQKKLIDLKRDNTKNYPLVATFELADGTHEVINAQYVAGCDGARSKVRASLGYELKGEAARQLWGVMDVLAITDFPDIRLKAAVQSADHGSILIIPREGGYMVRMYIEVDELREDERASDRILSIEALIQKAQSILHPYQLDVKEVAWWSAYEIGQRVCDSFDDTKTVTGEVEPRVFIAGDACHTHSPKAGQGMNVAIADAFNLGWKLAAVVRGQADKALLKTYNEERQAKAKELIDFDRDMARLFSAKSQSKTDAAQFQRYFSKHGRYTAGVETQYDASLVTVEPGKHQALAEGYLVGKRFHSAPVIRLADAKPMELGHILKADGRWRIVGFAPVDSGITPNGLIGEVCNYLQTDIHSPIVRYTPSDGGVDSVIDFRMVFQQGHKEIAVNKLPKLLAPAKGRYALTDYEKVFCANLKEGKDIFDLRRINRAKGALLVVRPDQYVSCVVPMAEYTLLSGFFDRFMLTPQA